MSVLYIATISYKFVSYHINLGDLFMRLRLLRKHEKRK